MTRNVVLVVNPSHATEREHAFWAAVAHELRRRDWFLVEVATRLLPYTPKAVSLTLPARLSDLNLTLSALPLGMPSAATGGWFDDAAYRLQEDWEYRRWKLDERLPAVLLGAMRLVSLVERTLGVLEPSMVLTLNKIDHNVAHFRRAALHHGIPTRVVERSPLDSIWLEPHGLFAESAIWDAYPAAHAAIDDELVAVGRQEATRLRGNPQGFRPSAAEPVRDRLRDLPRPLVFLPMDNVLWTGWEQRHHPFGRLDNPLYPDPFAAMRDLVDRVGARGGSLVVKRHPACLAVHAASVPAGAHLWEGDLGSFLAEADVVACFNTKVAFPALALGKPVLTMAPNPVASSGATYHCRRNADIDARLDEALRGEDLAARLGRFPSFLGWLSRDYFYQCREPESPQRRGPGRFVEDLLAAAGAPGVRLRPDELTARIAQLRQETRARLITGEPVAGSARPPAPHPASRPLVARGFDALRRNGPLEAGRRVLLWSLSQLGSPAVQRLLPILDRAGLDVREVKARFPLLVTYRRSWQPVDGSADEWRHFLRLWDQGLGRDGSLHPSGCSPRQRARWDALRGRHAGERVHIVNAATACDLPRRLADGEAAFLVGGEPGEAVLPGGRRPTFFTTLGDSVARCGPTILPPAQTIFLPQRFRGLFPRQRNVYWFGFRHGGSGLPEESGGDVPQGLCAAGGELAVASRIATFLGFTDIIVSIPSVVQEVCSSVRSESSP